MANTMSTQEPAIRIGISSCLVGQKVRFDGQHKHDRYLTDTLGRYFDWVPVCPEVELGLGTPRETIHLVQLEDSIQLQTTRTKVDLTKRMELFAKQRVRQLDDEDLTGYILKKDSPSCGMERVKVQQPKGSPKRIGVGVFAQALLERFPHLPVEEEGRLCDPKLRENWVERVFAYHALKQLWRKPWTIGDLVDFHTRHKFTLLAHSEPEYRQLGQLVAAAKSVTRGELRDRYSDLFMAAMKKIATTNKNCNVLQHILGFFKKELDAKSKEELISHIEDYRQRLVPLIVPLTLIAHYVRILDVPYLRDQVYLHKGYPLDSTGH
jgi:uncharacterized protein YbgA (DUF1722 family)/uncharacterized protein YbbK (DUF523 family)